MKKIYLFLVTSLLFILSGAANAQSITVSNAGTPGANGVYVESEPFMGKPTYIKGDYTIKFDCYYACEGWHLFFNGFEVLYYSNDPVESPLLVQTWELGMGMMPVPTISGSSLSISKPSAITSSSMLLKGYVPEDIENPVQERGFVYSILENPTLADTKVAVGSGSGEFSQTVNGLSGASTYYFRAFAISGGTITYSTQVQAQTFAGGDGTIANPYGISSWIQLNNMRFDNIAAYKLIANLDSTSEGYLELASATADQGRGWLPIYFKGNFDGQNYTLTGLTCNRFQIVGLFSEARDAYIKNIRLVGFSSPNGYDTGALVGNLYNSNVSNCHATGVNITGYYSNVGGLIGKVAGTSAIIDKCSATGNVTGYSGDYTGGLVGLLSTENYQNVVIILSNSFADVTVTANTYNGTGGLVGLQRGSTITNCYALGNVTGNNTVGGLIGRAIMGEILHSYSTGNVNSSNTFTGGLVGASDLAPLYTGSMYDQQTSGKSDTGKGTPKTTAQMKDISTYIAAGWDFNCESANGTADLWTINATDNNGYPALDFQRYLSVNCSQWNGTISDNFNLAANWTPAVVPGSNGMFKIPAVADTNFYPKLTASTTVRTIYMANEANLDLNGNSLTVQGYIESEGSLRANNLSTLIINSNEEVTTLNFDPAFNTLGNLTINTAGSVLVASPLTVSGVLDVQSGQLRTGDQLTLKSTSENTARVAPVTGMIAGKVNVERFIPAKRAWRALTTPLKGSATSIYTAWQNNGQVLADIGMEVWGPAGIGMATGPSYSVLSYTPSGYVNVTDTQSTLLFDNEKNNAFLCFVTGGYGSQNISSTVPATATTLTASGELITGEVIYDNLIDTKHTLIGNPYASPLNPATLLDGATNLVNKFWVWDPQLGLNGGYVSYDGVANTYSNSTGSYPNATTAIQSGQAFYVRALTGMSGSFTVTESKKSTETSNVFRSSNTEATPEIVRVGMYRQQNQDWLPLDGAIAVFYPSASNAVDNNDGKKFANGSENVAFRSNNTSLSSEHRTTITAQDTLHFRVWNTTPNTYKLHLNTEAFTSNNLVAKLQDLYTNTETVLDLSGAVTTYPFAVTTEAISYGDRFRIVFAENFLNIDGFTKSELQIYPNPVTDNLIHVNWGANNHKEEGSYQLINLMGQVVQKGQLEQPKATIAVPSLSSGTYLLKIIQENKIISTTKILLN